MARKIYAKNLAKKISSSFLTLKAPIKIEEILKEFKITIMENDFPEDSKIDALLIRKGENAFIVLNENKPKRRQRFSLAHELGHFLMHGNDELYLDKNITETFIFTRTADKKDDNELEANYFAAELLMPSNLIERDFPNYYIQDPENFISKMAEDYEVSEPALTYKLKELSLI